MKLPRIVAWLPLTSLLLLIGCTTGPMDIRETRYWAYSKGEDTNYYRLRVWASTRLGVAGYKSGWFPARAVDRLFGNVTSESGAAELQARTDLETQITEKIKTTQQAWLNAAANPKTSEATLRALMDARRRVLAYPRPLEEGPFPGAMEVEFNPGVGVATRYVDEKLVFVLSSDPDKIIGNLASFVEDDKTVMSVNRLAGLLTQRATVEVAAKEATLDVDKARDGRLLETLRSTQGKLKEGTTRAAALQAVDVLLTLIDSQLP